MSQEAKKKKLKPSGPVHRKFQVEVPSSVGVMVLFVVDRRRTKNKKNGLHGNSSSASCF